MPAFEVQVRIGSRKWEGRYETKTRLEAEAIIKKLRSLDTSLLNFRVVMVDHYDPEIVNGIDCDGRIYGR